MDLLTAIVLWVLGMAIGFGVGACIASGYGHWRGQVDAIEGRYYVGRQDGQYIRLDHPTTHASEVK